jgi:TolA-binding protein
VLLSSAQKLRPPGSARPRRAQQVARWSAAPLALAASLLAVLAVRSAAPAPNDPHRGRVQAASGARLTHTRAVLADGRADEVVRLIDGRVRVAVDPLRPGERFRVLVGDAELEVRGTEFDVAAEQDQLTAVLVHEGTVVVRPRGRAEASLARGERWAPTPLAAVVAPPTPPEAPSTEPAVSAEAVKRALAHSRRAAAAQAPPAPPLPLPEKAGLLGGATEEAFAEGWQALRGGDALGAAKSFGRAADSAPQTALAEDARFWEAVALARAGNAVTAARAMTVFLDRYPTNARAGELSAMLGWILLDQGRLPEAKARFVAALADPSPKVRESAEAGLLELDGR